MDIALPVLGGLGLFLLWSESNEGTGLQSSR